MAKKLLSRYNIKRSDFVMIFEPFTTTSDKLKILDVPILFALSDISVIALSATSADFAVSPFKLCNNDAENEVTVSIYSFAESPAVLYALLA